MLLLEDLQRPRLEIPAVARQQCWDDSSKLLSVEHCWNHYLNQLALAALQPWVNEHQLQSNPAFLSSLGRAFTRAGSENQPWQWVNGSCLAVMGQRWVVIPTDVLAVEDFAVPQEWVDIPSWAGDYYLMVQLDPEAGWLQVRGYLNHCHLKQLATYDEGDRTYRIDDDDLIQDLDLLWVMAELDSVTERRSPLAEIPSLSQHQAEPLIQRILQGVERAASIQLPLPQTAFSPRLALPFEQWAGIMANDKCRQGLAQDMQSCLKAQREVQGGTQEEATGLTQLRRWLMQDFPAAGQSWQALPSSRLGWRNLMPVQSISRGKPVILEGLEPDLMLWATILEGSDDRMQVLLQLRHSTADDPGARLLPQGIQLILLNPAEKSLQVVTARGQDDYIQLKRFKVKPGQHFSVEIRWGEQVLREQFQA